MKYFLISFVIIVHLLSLAFFSPKPVHAQANLYQIPNAVPDMREKGMTGIFNNKVYFNGYDTTYSNQLWVTDGTAAGTQKVKNIYPNPISGLHTTGSNPQFFVPTNSTLFFNADDGVHGMELWKTDGTSEGTVLVKDIYPGSTSSDQYEFIVYNNKIYFHADDGVHGFELWVSDGTESGTYMVKDINTGSGDATPYNFILYNNLFFFSAYDDTHGNELWRSDGTESGTTLVKDIAPGDDSGMEYLPVIYKNEMYFGANDGVESWQVWKSDGTESGTQMAIWLDPNGDLSFEEIAGVAGDKLLLEIITTAEGGELWASEGTFASLALLKDITPAGGTSFKGYTVMNNKLYFTAGSSQSLWVTDGTTAGTQLLKDIFSGHVPSKTNYYIPINNILYFRGYDSAYGYELWRSDGTTAGTYRITDINPGIANGVPPGMFYLTAYNNFLLFDSPSTLGTSRLWVYDASPPSINSATALSISNKNFPSNYAYSISFGPHYEGEQSVVISGTLESSNAQVIANTDASVHDIHITIDHESPKKLVEDNIKLPWQQGFNIAGEIFHFTSLSAFNGYPINQFDKPVIISIPYNPEKIKNIDPKKLKIGYYDSKKKKWKTIPNNNVINTKNHTIANTTKEFTYFTVVYPR